ncbi:MAG TPA: hypothetical protein VF316_03115, partial [Polyangiaceae bacterium]
VLGLVAIDVVDLATGRPVLTTKLPCTRMGQRDSFRWEAPSRVRFSCYDDEAGDDVVVVASWAGGHAELTKHAVQAP